MGLPREKTRATKFAVVKVCICVIILRKLHTGKLMLELDEFSLFWGYFVLSLRWILSELKVAF